MEQRRLHVLRSPVEVGTRLRKDSGPVSTGRAHRRARSEKERERETERERGRERQSTFKERSPFAIENKKKKKEKRKNREKKRREIEKERGTNGFDQGAIAGSLGVVTPFRIWVTAPRELWFAIDEKIYFTVPIEKLVSSNFPVYVVPWEKKNIEKRRCSADAVPVRTSE